MQPSFHTQSQSSLSPRALALLSRHQSKASQMVAKLVDGEPFVSSLDEDCFQEFSTQMALKEHGKSLKAAIMIARMMQGRLKRSERVSPFAFTTSVSLLYRTGAYSSENMVEALPLLKVVWREFSEFQHVIPTPLVSLVRQARLPKPSENINDVIPVLDKSSAHHKIFKNVLLKTIGSLKSKPRYVKAYDNPMAMYILARPYKKESRSMSD